MATGRQIAEQYLEALKELQPKTFGSAFVVAPRGVYARGHVMGVNEFGKVVELENDGDVDAYPRAQ